MKEVSPEEAQEMYASLPSELQSALRENAVEVFREEGIEPTPDEVDSLLLSLMCYLMNSIYSRFSEITQEEVDRVMDEEFERLDTDQGIDKEELATAVIRRLGEEYPHLLEPGAPCLS